MLSTADAKQETMEPFVLFGSSFPKDKEYTQVRRHLYIASYSGSFEERKGIVDTVCTCIEFWLGYSSKIDCKLKEDEHVQTVSTGLCLSSPLKVLGMRLEDILQ